MNHLYKPKKMSPKKKSSMVSLLMSSMVLISACVHEDDDEDNKSPGPRFSANVTKTQHFAVISTQASDFMSGNVSIVSLEDFSIGNSILPSKIPSLSDTAISTFGDNYYYINRTPDGNVSKFNFRSPSIVIPQHAAQLPNESTSNPYKLIVKDETTGYLLRWNTATIWIVNPSAADDETYKIGEIDLSDYSGDDAGAEATDAVLAEGKLYVVMQNLDKNNSYLPGTAYIAIFDTDNINLEVETNNDSDTPKGIALIGTNPSKLEYLSSNNTLYVSSVGSYAPDYNGGIEAVNIVDFSSSLIVDDGDVDNSPYGQTNNVAVLNSTRGYFIGSASYQNASLYTFNPTTGEVDLPPLIEAKDLGDIEIGPQGNLWVGNRSDVGITVINTVDNTVLQALISTAPLLPNDIEFISIENAN